MPDRLLYNPFVSDFETRKWKFQFAQLGGGIEFKVYTRDI